MTSKVVLMAPVLVAGGAFVAPPAVYAVTYLTEFEAQQAIFNHTNFEVLRVDLSDSEEELIEELSDTRVRDKSIKVYKSGNNEILFIDKVYGKHEFITYAVGLDSSGKVIGVEVLEYLETYGDEIREDAWRAQFIGKVNGDTLKLNETIENISGATLSCKHVTDGVRRLLTTRDVLLKAGKL